MPAELDYLHRFDEAKPRIAEVMDLPDIKDADLELLEDAVRVSGITSVSKGVESRGL